MPPNEARHFSKLELIEDLASEKLSGMIGLTMGKKYGEKDAFYGVLSPMTSAFFEYLYGPEPPDEPLATWIKNGFWKLIPEEQGEMIIRKDGKQEEKVKGRSGSLELAYDPAQGGYIVAGNLSLWIRPNRGPLAGVLIGVYNSPEMLRAAMRAEQQQHEVSKAEWLE